jgi:hypothetical protein
MSTTILIRAGLAGALLSLVATPAQAAKPVPVKAECSANKIGWAGPREFTVDFERTSNSLSNIEVSEQQRVFTPTDAKAIYTAGKRGGVIVDVPSQRPGKWSGKPNGGVDAFELKTKDGSASFALALEEANKTLRRLTWKAEMNGEDGQMLTAEGDGTCRVISTEADIAPAPEAAASPAPKADEAPAPEKPRKEIRIFGGRKGTPPEGEISK